MTYETTCRIHDPNNGEGTTSVRVVFSRFDFRPDDDPMEVATPILTVKGVYRLSDDSEIEFTSLCREEQDKIENECEYEYKHQKRL